MKRIGDFLCNDSGATVAEYAVLTGMVALVIIKGLALTGARVSVVF
jgi:Flp pilus assembly pilin Flp